MKKIFSREYSPTTGNTSLFVMVCILVFIIPVFPVASHRLLYNFSFTAVYFIAILSVDSKRKIIFWGAIAAMITEWLASYLDLIALEVLSHLVNLVFFTVIVLKMI